MRIGVTGATGKLGRLVVEGLLEARPAKDIVAIVRNEAKASNLVQLGVEVRVASYDDDAPTLQAALAGLDRLLLVSSSEVGQRVRQHRNAIDAAKSAGVGHLVYTSAPRATTTALILAPEHKATEEYLAESGLVYTVVRNNWYTENYAGQIETARQTGAIVGAAGAGRVASATRADYAAGAVAVLMGEGHEGKVYEFSGNSAWDYYELARTIAEIIAKPVAYRSVEAGKMVELLTQAGLDAGTAGFRAALDENIGAGLLSDSNDQLSTLIRRPTTALKEGLLTGLEQIHGT